MCQDWSLWTSLLTWKSRIGRKADLVARCRLFWPRYGKLIQAQLVNLKALSHPLHCHTHVFARRSLWHKPLPVENKNAHKIKPILLSWYWNYAQWSTWSSLGKVLHQWFMHCNWAEFLTRQGNLAWRVICLSRPMLHQSIQSHTTTRVLRHWSHQTLESLDIGVTEWQLVVCVNVAFADVQHWCHKQPVLDITRSSFGQCEKNACHIFLPALPVSTWAHNLVIINLGTRNSWINSEKVSTANNPAFPAKNSWA